MKYFVLLLSLTTVVMTSACAQNPDGHKRGWFFGMGRPLEWPSRHWEGQSFETNIEDQKHSLPAALDRDRSMFSVADIENLEPEEFIQNLKRADIIETAYYQKNWMLGKPNGTVVVDVDYNFYPLSLADKQVIGELLAQSYDNNLIILKDAHTHRTVGQIKDQAIDLF